MRTHWLLGAAFCLVGMQAPAGAQGLPEKLSAYLRGAAGLDEAQISAVRRGEAVVRVLETELSREIAVVGVAPVGLSRADFVRRTREPGGSAAARGRRRSGIFSSPPAAADVRQVVIDGQDLQQLKDCRPGACVMKLPAAAMARLQEEVDWTAADRHARVNDLARRALVEYAADYRARGDAALVVYDDRGNVRASEAFAELLGATPQLYEYVPALHRHLTGYPAAGLPGAVDVLFWSEEEAPQLRPVISVTHRVAYTPPDRPDLTLVASKQIYANHYFEGAFDLTCFVDAGGHAAAGRSGYVVVLRRFRFDRLSSNGPVNLRARVVAAMQRQLLDELQQLQGRDDPVTAARKEQP